MWRCCSAVANERWGLGIGKLRSHTSPVVGCLVYFSRKRVGEKRLTSESPRMHLQKIYGAVNIANGAKRSTRCSNNCFIPA